MVKESLCTEKTWLNGFPAFLLAKTMFSLSRRSLRAIGGGWKIIKPQRSDRSNFILNKLTLLNFLTIKA
jgi:hypothetical protein